MIAIEDNRKVYDTVDCPAWIEQECRRRKRSQQLKEIQRHELRNEAINKAKAFIAGCLFVVVALVTTFLG